MDNWMETCKKKISLPSCPKCKSILIYEPRYQNNIKTVFEDIEKIKKIMRDTNYGKNSIN